MKTFTKICLLAMVLLLPTFIIAQESLTNFTGNTSPDKQEFIQQLHGPTQVVPLAIVGGGKAVGDDCTNPVLISIADVGSDLPYQSVSQTTVGRGNNYDNTCLNDFDGGDDMIYQLDLDEDATLTFELDPKGTTYSGFALNEQCFDNPTATCLAVSTDTYGTGEAHGFAVALEAGTYYIMVDSWPNTRTSSIPDFDLNIALTSDVPNDECADAEEINEVMGLFFNTEEATSAGGATGGSNIWYKYTATVTGNVVFSVCGSFFDTQLALWDGCGGSNTNFNDDNCGFDGTQSSFTASVVAGNDYWIEIGGFDGASGIGYLDIYEDLSGCELTCPTGGTPEDETCGDDDNGGCNMDTPAFTSVSDGDTICGNSWANFGERDTDWFEISITEVSNIKLAVIGEEAMIFGMIAQVEQGGEGCDNLYGYFASYKQTAPCIEDSVEYSCLPVGTYYFMVAPTDFYSIECPGFDYQAAFTVDANPYGTISGTVDDGAKAGIEGVVVSADVYSATTASDGTYSILVPPGTYDVEADGFDVGYSSSVKSGEVVTDGNTTTVDFTLNDMAPVLTASADEDFAKVNLNWTPIAPPKNFKGTDIVMGFVEANSMYTPGATEDISFTLTIYAPFPDDPDYIEYFEITLPDDFTINSATDFPDDGYNSTVSANITGQTVSWTTNYSYLWHQSWVSHEFTINVTSDAGASGPQVCDYLLSGDGWTGDPDSFDGLVTIFEEGGSYVPTYNVYRVLDDGTGNEFIPLVSNIPDTELYDVIHEGNWCYFVTQNLDGGGESARSNIVCVDVLDPCEDAIDYGAPGDDPQAATLEYEEQIIWFSFTTLGGDVQISTCGSDFDTQFALYSSCDDIPEFPDMVPTGATDVVTDGCDDAGQAVGAICGLEAGTYYVAVYGENEETGEVELNINQDVQCLTIMDQWSGFSLYIEPAGSDNIEDVLADMAEEMIITIRQTPYGIWWVPENINTIGSITPVLGYKSKMDGQESTIVYGNEIDDKTVTIPAGASYLPVRVPYPTDINELATQLGTELLIIYNINNAAELYWPDGGLNTLPELLPDYAYQINVYNEVDFTYPTAKSSQPLAGLYTPAPYKGENVAWNDVVNTGNPHFISIQKAATDEIMIGDLIGVFNGDGLCVGVTEVVSLDENILVNAFGDDAYTLDVVDGLEEGEMMTFKLYRPSLDEEFAVEVSWNASMPNSDGTFAVNGMSMITNFKVGSTDISESEFAAVSIYPNPSTGMFNIDGLQADAQVTVTNAQGQVIFTGDVSENGLLDMSAQPKGVYFIRLMNDEEMMIQKVILK